MKLSFIKIRFYCNQNIRETLLYTECLSNVLITEESNFVERNVQLIRGLFLKNPYFRYMVKKGQNHVHIVIEWPPLRRRVQQMPITIDMMELSMIFRMTRQKTQGPHLHNLLQAWFSCYAQCGKIILILKITIENSFSYIQYFFLTFLADF